MTRIETAMVLAAGLGLRMRPLSESRPKPLLPLCGRTLLDRALDGIAAAGVTRIVVNTHYLAEMIAQHLDGQAGIVLSHEAERLETGGGVRRALPHLGPGPFFVVNSDSVWTDGETPTLTRLAADWDDARMDALLLLQPVGRAEGYKGPGDFVCEPDGRLRRRLTHAVAPFVFTGIQVLHPRLFDATEDGVFSLNRLYDRAERSGRLHGLIHDGGWYHVGTPEDLRRTEALLCPEGGDV